MKHLLLNLFVLCMVPVGISSPAQAQDKVEAVWDVSLTQFFDNREYNSVFSRSQTFFGFRLAPEIGIRFDECYSIMAGLNFLADYGARPGIKAEDYIAYFQYKGKKFNGYAGLIPRAKSMGNWAYAFFNDSINYYDPNISGLLLQYLGKSGYIELGVDWHSMISDTKREKFLLFCNTRLHFHYLYAGLQAAMYHHGTTHLDDELVDNILLYPHIGVNLAVVTRFDLFDLRAGWIQAFQNNRQYVGKYVTPGGFQLDIGLEKWHFGVNNTLYTGRNLMPYWVASTTRLDYGSGLYWGDPYYRTDSVYDRFELYWQPRIGKRISLRISSVHHYDGTCWGWQQKVHLMVNLGVNRLTKP